MRAVVIRLLWVVIAVFFLVCGIAVTCDPRDLRFHSEEVTCLTDGWHYLDEMGRERETALPNKEVSVKAGEVFRTFEEEIAEGKVLCFRSYQQSIAVFVGERQIYSHDAYAYPSFPKSAASAWHMVRLPHIDTGIPVTIRAEAAYGDFMDGISWVMLGTKAAVLYEIAENFLPTFLMGVLGIVIALMTAVYGIMMRKALKRHTIFYFGLLSFFLGLWFIGESKCMQFFVGRMYLSYQISYLTLAILPIPALLFFESALIPRQSWQYDCLCILTGINFFVMLGLQTLGMLDLYQTLPMCHVLIFVSIGVILHSMYQKYKEQVLLEQLHLFLGMAVFSIFSLLEMIIFYVGSPMNNALVIQTGVMIMMGIIGVGEMQKNSQLIQLGHEAELIKKVAYTDALTNLGNRYAFDKRLQELEEEKARNNMICILDIDRLKHINDTYGHLEGDALIKMMGACIEQAFGKQGRCYRIGGDEFAVLLQGNEEIYTKCIQNFDMHVGFMHTQNDFQIHVSYGMAQQGGRSMRLHDLFREADERMYEAKAKRKCEESKETVL